MKSYLLLTIALLIAAISACNGPKMKRQSSLSLITQETHWVGLNANGKLSARLTTADANCPKLNVDGQDLQMFARGERSAIFPTLVCELELPLETRSIFLGNERLPILPKEIRRIVVIGDTGCRIAYKKGGYKIQNCTSALDWPLARASEAAAKLHPDLVIHVGDYHYREAPCPGNNPECAGSTSGDNWTSWDQDFFAPAVSLLNAAPWIFARGNHELCNRAGIGWFQLLDPRPVPSACDDSMPPYEVKLADRTFEVIDAATDTNIQPSLNSLRPSVGTKSWLILHRPFLTDGADDESSLQNAIPSNVQKAIQMVLVGHQHRFSVQKFDDGRPPEIISGNGGTQLQKRPSKMDTSHTVFTSDNFGFMTAEKQSGNNWQLVERTADGDPIKICDLKENEGSVADLHCR